MALLCWAAVTDTLCCGALSSYRLLCTDIQLLIACIDNLQGTQSTHKQIHMLFPAAQYGTTKRAAWNAAARLIPDWDGAAAKEAAAAGAEAFRRRHQLVSPPAASAGTRT
jgi:hypothetical protein